jgi:hypothetical protein
MSAKVPSIKDLFGSGVHFGHQSNKWNPKMAEYIHSQNLGIHIIDLTKTEEALQKACDFLFAEASNGSQILFVGTKKQASEIIKIEAKRCESNFVSDRWIGGMLTNVTTIRSNIKKLTNLRSKMSSGDFESFTKKEKSMIFAGDIPQGHIAQLMHGDFNHLVEGAADAAKLAGENKDKNASALAILVSCIGRKLLLGQGISDETEAVADVFANKVPTIGFYSYGEICHQQFTGECSLHNQTMTVSVLYES